MPTREEMESLGQQIVHAYEDRAKGIAELRAAVAAQLAELARGSADRRAAVGAGLGELDRTHQAMGARLRADLAKDNTLRQAMGTKLRADLARGSADRQAAVTTHLADLDRGHHAMGTKLRADLDKGRADLTAMGARLRADLAQDSAGRRAAVGTQLAECDSEMKELVATRAGGQAAWRSMMATMQAKRGMPVAVVEAPPKVALPPPVRVEAPPVAPPPVVEAVAEEEAVVVAEVAEVTPEFAALQDRVFGCLANHPDGTRLVELEREFAVARIQMARVLRHLMDENKVEKRDLLYFAI